MPPPKLLVTDSLVIEQWCDEEIAGVEVEAAAQGTRSITTSQRVFLRNVC
ncbi:MAG: hypothetical protein ACOWYE_02305 [Desulfatiglandales bacterium]